MPTDEGISLIEQYILVNSEGDARPDLLDQIEVPPRSKRVISVAALKRAAYSTQLGHKPSA